MKEALFRLFAGLFILIVCLAMGEVYARIVYKESYLTGVMVSDPVFHHLPRPQCASTMSSPGDFDLPFRTNNKSMRGPGDYDYAKAPGTFRIAVLGDSFTFGVGVRAEKTASAVLAGLLAKRPDRRYEVLNFGVNSFSPVLEYLYLTKEAVSYRPDLVILMLDVCDIQDDYYYEPHLVYDRSGGLRGCDPFMVNGHIDWKALCMKYSRLFFILDQKLGESFRKMRSIGFRTYIGNKIKGIRNKKDILADTASDNIYFDRFLLVREGKDPAIKKRHWARTGRYIRKMRDFLASRNIGLLVVTYPYGHEVGANQWQKGRVYWGFRQDTVYDPGDGFRIIRAFMDEERIPFIDLCGTMAAHAGEKLYYESDGHWTERGQELAAQAIDSDAKFNELVSK